MSGSEDSIRRPNLSPWLRLSLVPHEWMGFAWPMLQGVLGALRAISGDLWGLAWVLLPGLCLLYMLVPWYWSFHEAPTSPEPPAPRIPRVVGFPLWTLVWVTCFLAALAVGFSGQSGPAWHREGSVIVTGLAGLAVLAAIFVWGAVSARRLGRDRSALGNLQEALTDRGLAPRLLAASAFGDATWVCTTPDGPELMWYVALWPQQYVLPETVHLMWAHLRHYDFRRGWLVSPGLFSPRLVRYARQLGIRLVASGHFAEAVPEAPPAPAADKPLAAPSPADASLFQPRATRLRS
jgi:hypothetical protein